MRRRRFWIEADLLDCPAVTRLAITLQLLVTLIPIRKHEWLCHDRCLSGDLLSEAGGWLHLLVRSGASVPFIVEIVGIVIGHTFPVDDFAVRREGCEEIPMTRDAPAPGVAAAIPTTTRITLTLPAASAMTVSMTVAAALKSHAMTGAAIAAIRPMSDGESYTPESNGNQTGESSKV